MALSRAALVAIVAGAVFAPATVASASHRPAKIQLALVPLQRAQLGSAGASLALDYGSGSVDKRDIGLKFVDLQSTVSDADFKSFHGIARYALDYGDAFTGSTGVMEIRSSVEEYTTRATAKKGFALWRHVDSFAKFPATRKKIQASPVGQRQFAYLFTWAAPNLNPIVKLDEQVLSGRFVLDLTVTAGSASSPEHVAPHLLRVLHRRLQLMLEGHAAGKPAKLPPKPEAGQEPGGPDLLAMILQPSDVSPEGADVFQQYTANLPALSAYLMVLDSAGPFDVGLDQEIFWWPTATEATYAETYMSADLATSFGAGSDVDLSAVGDPATGYLLTPWIGGGSLVGITLTNGQAGEFITAVSSSPLQNSDVQSLAQAAANRLDAGLGP